MEAQLDLVPTSTTVTITCSSKLGVERTIEHTARAAKDGYQVVPHLAAGQVTGKAELAEFVRRLDELGVTNLYVIGGDASPAGPYGSAADLLDDLQTLEHGLPARAAARRHRRWVYVELPGVGHVPQLQVPRQLADHVLTWMDDALASQVGPSRR